tara:strand:+ start:1232 stop:2137 length:906 start_codon:yes stop_codon:yes gene_type:complete
MKTLIISSLLLILSILTISCNSSGGKYLGNDDNNGKAYSIGDDAMSEKLLMIAEAYSNQDTDELLKHYDGTFLGENGPESTRKWLESMDSITMEPYIVIPVKLEGDPDTKVLTWSKEERHYKNGSYEKLDLMEFFNFNKYGKVDKFRQWKSVDSSNFGKSYGGKFIGEKDNEYKGRPLVFSDRNEVEIIENMIKAYNDMDPVKFAEPFADVAVLNDYKGKTMEMTKEDMAGLFKDYNSVNWNPYAIIPLKIYNTDAASGVQVMSKETRVFKNGKVWEKELFEIFYFDLEGKITSMTQYARD